VRVPRRGGSWAKTVPSSSSTLVNVSPEEIDGWDTNVYEASLIVDAGDTLPFTLDNLPDSFRYDRTVEAYGVNGGIEKARSDLVPHDRCRDTQSTSADLLGPWHRRSNPT